MLNDFFAGGFAACGIGLLGTSICWDVAGACKSRPQYLQTIALSWISSWSPPFFWSVLNKTAKAGKRYIANKLLHEARGLPCVRIWVCLSWQTRFDFPSSMSWKVAGHQTTWQQRKWTATTGLDCPKICAPFGEWEKRLIWKREFMSRWKSETARDRQQIPWYLS